MKHRYSSLISPVNILVDFFCLNFSFILSFYMKFNIIDSIFHSPYIILYLLVNLLWAILLLILRPYNYSRVSSNISHTTSNLLGIIVLHSAGITFYWFAMQTYYYSRIQLGTMYLFFFTLGVSWRIVFTYAIRQYRLKGFNHRNYIIIGAGDLSKLIIQYHETHPELGYKYNGYFDDEIKELPLWRGNYHDTKAFLELNNIDYIYCYLPKIERGYLNEIINYTNKVGCEVKLLIDFSGFVSNKVSIEYHDFIPVIGVSSKPFYKVSDEILKRCFDISLSSLGLILGSPIFILIALITKLSSKGNIIFKQERTGRWGNKFTIYKFRSMYTNSSQIHSKGISDPRITTWGHFMRKTRLDELPQLFNVLKGDMSIVGPRPLANYDAKTLFENMPDEYKLLLSVKPGLTSIGQVNYGYASNELEIIERAKEDLMYIPSFRQDISLIFQTLRVIVQGKGK